MKRLTFLAALTATPIFAQEAAQPQGGSALGAFLPFILLFVVMWLFFVRPKQKEMKKQDEMRKALKKGDKVTTFAGIIGVVHSLDDNTVTLRTGSSTIEFQKMAVQAVIQPVVTEAPKDEKAETK